MLDNLGDAVPLEAVRTVTCAEELAAMQRQAREIAIAGDVADYIVAIAQATRVHPLVKLGVSPRGSRSLYKAAKVRAAMEGRNFVTPDDVQEIAVPVLAHRMMLSNEARLSHTGNAQIIEKILEEVPVPPARKDRF